MQKKSKLLSRNTFVTGDFEVKIIKIDVGFALVSFYIIVHQSEMDCLINEI